MKYLILVLVCVCPFLVFSQADNEGRSTSPGQMWNEIVFAQGLNKNLVSELNFQISSSNDLKADYPITKYVINYSAKGSLHYFFKPKIKLSANLVYAKSPEVTALKQIASSDIKFGLQFQHFVTRGRYTLFNRFKVDERINLTENNKRAAFTSLSYMPKLFVALNGKSVRAKTYYFIVSDELVFNLNQGTVIDQNKITAGLGYCFTDDIKFELSYINRYNNQLTGIGEYTNIVSLSLTLNNIKKMLTQNKD